jgi:hypothetical protein
MQDRGLSSLSSELNEKLRLVVLRPAVGHLETRCARFDLEKEFFEDNDYRKHASDG